MSIIDPKIEAEIKRKTVDDLVNQMELYMKQEDFTHPGFYSLLRQFNVPYGLLVAITNLSDKLKIKHCHADYYAMINRKIKEKLYPLMVAYHRGLVMEGDAIWSAPERDKRDKVIRTTPWRDKVQGLMRRNDSSNDESPDIE